MNFTDRPQSMAFAPPFEFVSALLTVSKTTMLAARESSDDLILDAILTTKTAR
jgi:hypothetical protein